MEKTFLLNDYYKIKQFEYPQTGYKELPFLEKMRNSVRLLLGVVKNFITKEFLSLNNEEALISVQSGKVDCGFLIWYRSQKYGISTEEQPNLSLNNYFSFLNEIGNNSLHEVVILGAALPTSFTSSCSDMV